MDLSGLHKKEAAPGNVIFLEINFMDAGSAREQNGCIKIVAVRLFKMAVAYDQMILQGAEIKVGGIFPALEQIDVKY